MSSPIALPPQGFESLSREEQLAYVEELATHISPPDEDDIPEWHREILDARMAKYSAEGFEGITLEEFERELADEFGELTETD